MRLTVLVLMASNVAMFALYLRAQREARRANAEHFRCHQSLLRIVKEKVRS